MNKQTRNIIWQSALLLFVQLFVLNEIELHGSINPYIYPLIILMFPYSTPAWAVVILSFFVGIAVDIHANLLGFHAAAAVFVGFVRTYILRFIQPSLGYDDVDSLSDPKLGISWFLSYVLIAVSLHHVFYFFLEAGGFQFITITFSRIAASLFSSVLLILLCRYLLYKIKK